MTFTKNSKSELEIKDFIESGGFECKNDRRILNGKEIDLYFPGNLIILFSFYLNSRKTFFKGTVLKHHHSYLVPFY